METKLWSKKCLRQETEQCENLVCKEKFKIEKYKFKRMFSFCVFIKL